MVPRGLRASHHRNLIAPGVAAPKIRKPLIPAVDLG
jgi:hypothetical protein